MAEVLELKPTTIDRPRTVAEWDPDEHLLITPSNLPDWDGYHLANLRRHKWDGNRERPTYSPSIGVGPAGSEKVYGWHGWVIDGRMSEDLEALKAMARPKALEWFEAQ